MSLQKAQDNFSRYVDSGHQDLSMLTDDVVFTNMATGEEHRGVEAVHQMLQYIYHVAFDARAETTTTIVTEKNALLEGHFVGRHTAEFAGIPATHREVRVPLAVIYDLHDGMIRRARIYFEVPALMAQINGAEAMAAAAAKTT